MMDERIQILHSGRANIYYLEHCRVMVRGETVVFVTPDETRELYRNIPVANTTFLLLGSGTSITQAAVRLLASARVPVGFCGGGGTPLFGAVDLVWITPQDEYQTTAYLHRWMDLWREEGARLSAAKTLQKKRAEFTQDAWEKIRRRDYRSLPNLKNLMSDYQSNINGASSTQHLLSLEANLTKKLYSMAAGAVDYGAFSRTRQSKTDPANQHLDQGNYLAYGAAAVVVWVLGLHAGLSILHGKTRRGGLVFDIADIIKDGIILPQAFISAKEGHTSQQFRGACLDKMRRLNALSYMFNTVKDIAENARNTP